ncbi:MAG: MipA/OmpV family protein [Oceanospirillaceae bacterium]|nr:MipA/OmpV family protein [Oceanospirillaceae bacterium]
MKMNTLNASALATSLSIVTLPVFAESDELEIGLGLGAGFDQSIYQGIDSQTDVLPMLELSYGNFFFGGLEAGYLLAEEEHYSLSISVAGDELDGERTDSNVLKDMGDVDSGINLKLSGELFTEYGLLGASIAQDVSNEHEGTELSLNWAVPLEFDQTLLMPSVYATWMSDDLVNHYYGVSAKHAKAGRPQYNADAGWRYGVDIMAEYPLSQQWTLMGGVGAEWYGDEITNSPIVDEDSAISGFMGVTYHF